MREREKVREKERERERERERESTKNVPLYNSSYRVQEEETNEIKKRVQVLCLLRVVIQKQRWW